MLSCVICSFSLYAPWLNFRAQCIVYLLSQQVHPSPIENVISHHVLSLYYLFQILMNHLFSYSLTSLFIRISLSSTLTIWKTMGRSTEIKYSNGLAFKLQTKGLFWQFTLLTLKKTHQFFCLQDVKNCTYHIRLDHVSYRFQELATSCQRKKILGLGIVGEESVFWLFNDLGYSSPPLSLLT